MTLRIAATFARRELRGGLRGFRVFLACLALGVAAIAAVGTVRAAIEAEGLRFVDIPVTHQGLNDDMVASQSEAAATGKTLAYCASGTRSTIVWALGQAGSQDPDAIIKAAADAGYDLGGLRDRLG